MQLHKRFTTEQVKAILKGYQQGNVGQAEVLAALEIKPATFFRLLKRYRQDPEAFTLAYRRPSPKKISAPAEKRIKQAIHDDQQLIQDPDLPVWTYNYSAIRDRLRKEGVT